MRRRRRRRHIQNEDPPSEGGGNNEIQNKKVREDLSDGLKRVYVAPGDTLEVFLFYDHYLSQVKNLENEYKVQSLMGFSLFGLLIFLLFISY